MNTPAPQGVGLTFRTYARFADGDTGAAYSVKNFFAIEIAIEPVKLMKPSAMAPRLLSFSAFRAAS